MSELISGDSLGFAIDTAANSADLVVALQSDVPAWKGADTLAKPTVSIAGAAIGSNDWLVELTDFQTVGAYTNVAPGTLASAFSLTADFLSMMQDDSVFAVDVPFLDIQLHDAIDLGDQLWEKKLSGIVGDDDQVPTFTTINELSNLLQTDWLLDSAASTLSIPVTALLEIPKLTVPITIPGFNPDDSANGLADLATHEKAELTGNAQVSFDFIVNLAPDENPNSVLPSEQVSLSDLDIDWNLSTLNPDFAGEARMGIIGFDFDGVLTGSPTVHADIVNPINGSATSSITQLYSGLGDSASYLPAGLQTSNDSLLRLNNIAVQNDLLSVAKTGYLEVAATIGENSADHHV